MSATARQSVATPAPSGHPLGKSPNNRWLASETLVDMSMEGPPPRRLTIATEPQAVTVDLNRTALVVIDMQNDFCAKGGWVDHLGADYTPDRHPIDPRSIRRDGSRSPCVGRPRQSQCPAAFVPA